MTHATLICLRYAHQITYIQIQMDIPPWCFAFRLMAKCGELCKTPWNIIKQNSNTKCADDKLETCLVLKDFAKLVLNFSVIPMEVFLILIHIVLFSSDNLDPFQSLTHKREIENIQTEYMLFLHRWAGGGRVLIRIQERFEALYYTHKSSKSNLWNIPSKCKYFPWGYQISIMIWVYYYLVCIQ